MSLKPIQFRISRPQFHSLPAIASRMSAQGIHGHSRYSLQDRRFKDLVKPASRAIIHDPDRSPLKNITVVRQPLSLKTAKNYASDDKLDLMSKINAGRAKLPFEKAEFLEHIEGVHLNPTSMAAFGLPVYDLERAAFLDFKYPSLAEKITQLLGLSEAKLFEHFPLMTDPDNKGYMTEGKFRQWLVKFLLALERFGIAEINWKKVERVYPNARQIELDLNRDTADVSFFDHDGNKMFEEYFGQGPV